MFVGRNIPFPFRALVDSTTTCSHDHHVYMQPGLQLAIALDFMLVRGSSHLSAWLISACWPLVALVVMGTGLLSCCIWAARSMARLVSLSVHLVILAKRQVSIFLVGAPFRFLFRPVANMVRAVCASGLRALPPTDD